MAIWSTSLKLRTGPRFCAVAVKPYGRIQRLHRRVGQVRKFILGDDPVRRRRCRSIAFASPRATADFAGGAGELFVLRHQLRTVGSFDAGEVPFDLQPVARLLRRPELVGDNGDPVALAPVGFRRPPARLPTPRAAAVVQALDARPEDRRMGHNRHLHSGQVEVETEFQRAVTLRPAVESPNLFPTSRNSDGSFEPHARRHGPARGVARQFGILGGLAARVRERRSVPCGIGLA